MKIAYVYDKQTKIYAGKIECYYNSHTKLWKKPVNSTFDVPPPDKEMNEIKWNGKKWYYDPMK